MTSIARARVRRPSPLALPTLLTALFVVPIGVAGTATVLPDIASELGADTSQLQWVVNGYNTSFAIFTLVWGSISDRIGYRSTFVVGTTLTVVGSVASSCAPNLLVLDGARLLAGVGSAAIGTSVTSILAGAFEGRARARGFALFGTILGIGLAAGPSIAGGLTALFGWRGVFVAFAVVVGVALAFSAAVPRVRHEPHPDRKILDIGLLRNRRFLAVVFVPVVQAFGYIALLTYLPVGLSALYGLSAGAIGLAMIAFTGPVLFGPALGAWLVRTRPWLTLQRMVYASIGLMLVGNAGMLLVAADVPLWALIAPMIILGLSFGLPLGLLDGAAQEAAPAHSSGSAAGIMNFLRLGSETIAVGVYAAVLAGVIASRITDPELAERVTAGAPGHASDFTAAFIVGQVGILLLVLLGLFVAIVLGHPRRRGER